MIVIILGSSSQNDYNLSTSQRHSLVSHKFKDDREVETVVTRCLTTEDTDFYQQGIDILFPRSDKCLRCGGNYVRNNCNCWRLKLLA
jgi:hypothetical protein